MEVVPYHINVKLGWYLVLLVRQSTPCGKNSVALDVIPTQSEASSRLLSDSERGNGAYDAGQWECRDEQQLNY